MLSKEMREATPPTSSLGISFFPAQKLHDRHVTAGHREWCTPSDVLLWKNIKRAAPNLPGTAINEIVDFCGCSRTNWFRESLIFHIEDIFCNEMIVWVGNPSEKIEKWSEETKEQGWVKVDPNNDDVREDGEKRRCVCTIGWRWGFTMRRNIIKVASDFIVSNEWPSHWVAKEIARDFNIKWVSYFAGGNWSDGRFSPGFFQAEGQWWNLQLDPNNNAVDIEVRRPDQEIHIPWIDLMDTDEEDLERTETESLPDANQENIPPLEAAQEQDQMDLD